MAQSKKGTTTCLIIGAGCFGVALIAIVGFIFFAYKTGKDIERAVKNPSESIAEILGTDTLPPGYHANLALKFPFGLMSLAIISDLPQEGEEPNVGEDGFMLFELIRIGEDDRREIKDYLTGQTEDSRALERNNINLGMRGGQLALDRGSFAIGSGTAYFTTVRSGVDSEHATTDGISAILLIECPQEKRFRLGVRFGPDPNPGAPDSELELNRSVCDPANLESFLNYFRFCGEQ